MMLKRLYKPWMESKETIFETNAGFSLQSCLLDQLITLVSVCHLHVSVRSAVVEVDRLAMVEIVIRVVIAMIRVIVVVIRHDRRTIGK